MKSDFLKKIGKSVLRITAALAIILGVPVLCYWLWEPGSNSPLDDRDRDNAIWLGHGWLGDDGWFSRNKRDKNLFRNEKRISALCEKLAANKINTVYPHLCPAYRNGRIARYDSAQVERFLNIAARYDIKVIPWIGGVLDGSARPDDLIWRKNFVSSVDELLKTHPRLAGVQVNIEPLPSGNPHFLKLLEELRTITQGKILGVAAYPPPTGWHQYPDVHWELSYITEVARRCDQLAVMMYDTAIPLEKFYTRLIFDWTRQLVDSTYFITGNQLILGIPAYEDAGVGYHHPRVENISSALRGIAAQDLKKWVDGFAIYCEWEMTEDKWQIWQKFVPPVNECGKSSYTK